MMKLKYLIIILFLTGCGSLSEAGKALRNEKINSTDEFLIEKRGPLTLPPDMNELPKPRSQTAKKIKEKAKSSNESSKSDLEKIILQEIEKN